MDQFIQQFATGLSTGSLYAIIALALVLIYRSTGIVNFAQGEMAMFMTFVAWSIWNSNSNFWLAFFIALVIAGAFGALTEMTIIRPVEIGPVLNPVIVTVGLFTVLQSAALRVWQGEPKFFPTPSVFKGAPLKLGPAAISRTNVGVFCMAIVIMLLIYFFFNYTKLGLAMRATAQNRTAGRLVGIRTGRMLATGWALSTMVGAVAGILLAPVLFLSPSMMDGVLLFAFAAAVLGGLDSSAGAIVGGLTIGVVQNMAGTYIPNGSSIDITVAFVVIIAVLLVRPHGIFGRKVVQRV
ncbi:MAG: branched-chain amino acid ABC transporter permease [Dehalococcoidia bacterium]|jgi:branched-chain amino acid transport system permease protein